MTRGRDVCFAGLYVQKATPVLPAISDISDISPETAPEVSPPLRAATGRGDHQSPLDAAMSRPNTGECIVSGYLHVAPSFARSAVLLSVIGCRKQFLRLDVGRFVTPRVPQGSPGACLPGLVSMPSMSGGAL